MLYNKKYISQVYLIKNIYNEHLTKNTTIMWTITPLYPLPHPTPTIPSQYYPTPIPIPLPTPYPYPQRMYIHTYTYQEFMLYT